MKKTAAGKGKHVDQFIIRKSTHIVFSIKNRDSLLKVITKIGNYYELKDKYSFYGE